MPKIQEKNKMSQPSQTKIMNSKHYLQSLYQSYKKKSFIPSYEIKYQISSIRQKLVSQKQRIIQQLRQQSVLQQTISEEDLIKYYHKKEQYKNNTVTIQIVKRSKEIFELIQQSLKDSESNYIFMNSENYSQLLLKELNLFTTLFKLIEQLDTFLSENSSVLTKQENMKKNEESTNSFVLKLYLKIFKTICQKQNEKLIWERVQKIMAKHNLPLKRNMAPKEPQKTPIDPKDLTFLRYILHRQACQYALSNFLSSLTNNDQSFKYNSSFFSVYNKKINSSIEYLFIEKHQSHNFLEPNWMFDYIQQTFTINYQYIKEHILLDLSPQIQGSILIYVLQYSIQQLFYQNIRKRFDVDLNTGSEAVSDPFFYFRFIDTLHELEQKLTITFSQQISLLQNILIEFEIKKQLHILDRNFDYEHKWIEQKIFKDFWQNINYSNIDLKNIQAYNIVTNFNVLFQKLYSKFSAIYDNRLVKRINKFYQETVTNLAAHIKTSFQRIYNHSGLDKLNIILAFKRVDNEFKSGLNVFISKDLEFEKKIRKEYYEYIVSLFNDYSLEQLSIYHRRLLKAATESEQFFIQNQVSEQEENRIKEKSQKVFKNWQNKLEELNKVYSYRDGKIKNQFFTFLQSVDFTQKGISLFLEFYEAFLKVYYSFQAYNVLKMVILMDKKQQLEYLKVHNNLLNFLLESEFNAIRKLKIR